MQSTKTWHVSRDAPPHFKTTLKEWLDKYREQNEGQPEESQDATATELETSLERLDRLEHELKPLEWLAQSVWQQAGNRRDFDFDLLYAMVAPSDEVAFGPDERANLRSKLDELFSRMLDVNDSVDRLVKPLLKHMPTANVYRVSSTITLKRSVWAVIIGIDSYSYSPLQCAVRDAESMTSFLTSHLGVPKDHITELLAPPGSNISAQNYPTRQNILSKLWSLHQDERIRHGDTIIVFYAGHGAFYYPPHSASAEGGKEPDRKQKQKQQKRVDLDEYKHQLKGPFVDMICPADYGFPDTDPTKIRL